MSQSRILIVVVVLLALVSSVIWLGLSPSAAPVSQASAPAEYPRLDALSEEVALLRVEVGRLALLQERLPDFGAAREVQVTGTSSENPLPGPEALDGPAQCLQRYVESFRTAPEGLEFYRLQVIVHIPRLIEEISLLLIAPDTYPTLRIRLLEILVDDRLDGNSRVLSQLLRVLRSYADDEIVGAALAALEAIGDETICGELERIAWMIYPSRFSKQAFRLVVQLTSEPANALIARLLPRAPSDDLKRFFLELMDRTDVEEAVQVIRGVMRESQPLRLQAAESLRLLHSPFAMALVDEWLVFEQDGDVRVALGEARDGPTWGPWRATGPPDVEDPMSDDVRAWAPVGTQVGLQTLTLDYDPPTHCSEVRVHQVHRPGAIVSIHAIEPNGTRHLLPQGRSLSPGGFLYASTMPTTAYPVKRLVVTLDTNSVGGYNEIDAVGIVGPSGLSWAVAASASSYFGQ